jgi:hypothetical protein
MSSYRVLGRGNQNSAHTLFIKRMEEVIFTQMAEFYNGIMVGHAKKLQGRLDTEFLNVATI